MNTTTFIFLILTVGTTAFFCAKCCAIWSAVTIGAFLDIDWYQYASLVVLAPLWAILVDLTVRRLG